MNCSYFAIERRRTWKVIKKIKHKKNKDKYKTKISKQASEEYITHAQWNIVGNFSKILRFSTLYNERNSRHFQQLKNSCHTSIESQKKSHLHSFQVLTYTPTIFTIFSFESRPTQASISLECKSRLASCVIFAVGTLVTSVLKKKKNEDERRNEIPNDRIHENLHKH